ncbi:DUF1254 domain-containing protein [Falsiphaeobacter marinintestinus]|uniref:DUF1254 domain-containing protein n=1 Tax=Falsiphaeobacter marinintestinus TaxID=1492905 RepID=UPI00164876F8|nr:DUF1254 domain-containing protein [Phaeobacter marinintestinus]
MIPTDVRNTILGAGMLALTCTVGSAESPTYSMTTDIPTQITTPDSVETSIGTLNFFDGVPDNATVSTVYDYVDRARAVQAYIATVPGVSQYAMRQGQREIGATKVNQILIWDELADSKSLFLTGNSSTIYTWTYTDLATDGPTVIELPPGMLGAVDDMWFRYVTDLGIAGPDQGKGGKYLILPPGYEGEVPDGYFVVQPATSGNWIFMRAYISEGVEKAAQGVKDNLRIYPLSMVDKPPEPEFFSMSGRAGYNAVPPNDYSYWEMLNQLVQEEPVGAKDPETRGLLRSLGMVKGQPFEPDARMKAILTDAVAIGNAFARANTVFPQDSDHRIYGPDSEWIMAFAGKDTTFLDDGARRFDSRLWMHYNAVVVTPAMAVTVPGKGSDYGIAGLAKGAEILNGAKTYKLTLPPNVPVADFWSVTVYDTQTRSMMQTDQRYPAVDSYGENVKQNADGSWDIYFAPEAPEGKEGNWIQTIPGKSWFIILRMYGPLEPWLNKTWVPGEIELVE